MNMTDETTAVSINTAAEIDIKALELLPAEEPEDSRYCAVTCFYSIQR